MSDTCFSPAPLAPSSNHLKGCFYPVEVRAVPRPICSPFRASAESIEVAVSWPGWCLQGLQASAGALLSSPASACSPVGAARPPRRARFQFVIASLAPSEAADAWLAHVRIDTDLHMHTNQNPLIPSHSQGALPPLPRLVFVLPVLPLVRIGAPGNPSTLPRLPNPYNKRMWERVGKRVRFPLLKCAQSYKM